MKDPLKLARKEFSRCGGELALESDYGGQIWTFPWGERLHLKAGATLRFVRSQVERIQAKANPLWGFVPAPAPPLSKIEGSAHFTERFTQMSEQAGLTNDEVRAAALDPAETRFNAELGNYAYIRDRVAVIVAPKAGSMRLVTLFWTSRDLWIANPRPERTERHG